MLTGERPFGRRSLAEIVMARAGCRPFPLARWGQPRASGRCSIRICPRNAERVGVPAADYDSALRRLSISAIDS